MSRFGNTDNEYSRFLTGDTSLGAGDHTVTNKGVVGRIIIDRRAFNGCFTVKHTSLEAWRAIAAAECRPCIEVTRPYPGPRTAYMCNCGCEKMWMPTVDAS